EKNAWAITSRGETYRLMGNHETALADFNRAIELDEKNVWAIASRGETYQLMGNYETALANFNRAIDLDEQDDWAIALRGRTYMQMENYEAALTDLNRAIELEPGGDNYLCLRGITKLLMGQTEEAKEDIAQAISLARQNYEADSQNWENTTHLFIYHLIAGEVAEAERLYSETLTSGVPAHTLRKAVTDLNELLRLLPDDEETK
ncbi:MAG: tetratricopeptide repeat protein, partial [Chloroflexi bacterium]|nr:tetratricopeptide repeat protein [Chloroflexota bacterium]MCI0645793.1 tetratricopeptide repeat protein [Chloroflexota bacterium]MCI0727262.1 tetratricopeptide repeat protein [Chloroflexota bacterium]